MMVIQLNQYKSFHKNGWNLSLFNSMLEFIYDEEFFTIVWSIGNLDYLIWFRYGQYNYFEIVNKETGKIDYCSNKDLMKKMNKQKEWWDKAVNLDSEIKCILNKKEVL